MMLPAFAQDPYVELIVEPGHTLEIGQQLNLTVKSNVQGDVNIDLPKQFAPGNNVFNGMEREYDQASGNWITFMFSSKSGTFTKPGEYTIGLAYVRKGNKVYRSNKIDVVVRAITTSIKKYLQVKSN